MPIWLNAFMNSKLMKQIQHHAQFNEVFQKTDTFRKGATSTVSYQNATKIIHVKKKNKAYILVFTELDKINSADPVFFSISDIRHGASSGGSTCFTSHATSSIEGLPRTPSVLLLLSLRTFSKLLNRRQASTAATAVTMSW